MTDQFAPATQAYGENCWRLRQACGANATSSVLDGSILDDESDHPLVGFFSLRSIRVDCPLIEFLDQHSHHGSLQVRRVTTSLVTPRNFSEELFDVGLEGV